jgi:hypothetical protein
MGGSKPDYALSDDVSDLMNALFGSLITSPKLVDAIHVYLEKIEQDKTLNDKDVIKLRSSVLEELTPIIL